MKKERIKALILMVLLSVSCFSFMGKAIDTKAAAKPDARIVDYDSESRTERFHFGRNIGDTVNVAVIGDKDSMIVTNVKLRSSDNSVCSIVEEEDYFELNFLKEGIAVITMTCKVDDVAVEKKLLASCLTSFDSIEGILKAGSIAYRGCSDQEGISSKDTEIKDKVTASKEITINGMCGSFYRVWLEDETFGDSSENWAYVKKEDVEIPLQDIIISEEMSMYEETEGKINIQCIPSIATAGDFTWKSSNINVVRVDENGKLTAGKRGSAVVTVTSKSNSEISKKCRVTVKPFIQATGISINPEVLNVDDGEEGKIEVEVLPEEASNKNYKVKVENESIIQVTGDGEFIALQPGTTAIRVISEDGGYTDTCIVNVKFVEATGVWVQPTMMMALGDVTEIDWNMIPVNATNKNVKWKSSNENIVKIDKAGNCIAKSEGIAKIQVITEDGYTSYCTVMVKDYVEDIRLGESDIKLSLGKSKTLKCNIYPKEATNKKLIWSSNAPGVVSVTNAGKIKALKTGDAEIFVYDRISGAFDFCFVEVNVDLKTPKLTVKKKKKKSILSWKKINHATSYVLYKYNKKAKKYKKFKIFKSETLKTNLGKVKKNQKYRLKAYYKPNNEQSAFSNIVKIK